MPSVVVGSGTPEDSQNVALDRTVGATSPEAAPSGPSLASRASSFQRTTILPRVKVRAGARELVHADGARYERVKPLGEGGAGEVALVRDHDIQRHVALKQLRAGTRGDRAAVLRFVEEIQTIGQLEHPGVVPIHDVGVDENGGYFFVMKYVEGDTLEDLVAKLAAGDPALTGAMTVTRRLEIFLKILQTVAFAHARGIVHRDLKPSNIMIGRYGEVMVMDWGLAKRIRGPGVEASATPEELAHATTVDGKESDAAPCPPERLFRTRHGSLLGTPGYMAPEQARGQNDAIDFRSDVYALSAILFELLFLRHYLGPPRASLAEMLHAVLHDKPDIRLFKDAAGGTVPVDCVHVVMKGLQKDPAKRFQSVDEMIARVEQTIAGRPTVDCHVTLVKRANGEAIGFLDRHPMLGFLAFASGLALAVYGAVSLARGLLHF
jgi:serine/threonine-protein kinase